MNRFKKNFSRGGFGRQSFGNRGGNREMHHAVCSDCGKDCEVPFEPTGSKPVYCNDCFRKNNGRGESRNFQDRGPQRHDFERRNESRPQNNEQFETINRKLDKILDLLYVPRVMEKKEPKIEPEDILIIPKKKTKTSKKKIS